MVSCNVGIRCAASLSRHLLAQACCSGRKARKAAVSSLHAWQCDNTVEGRVCDIQVSAVVNATAVQEQLKENTLEEGLENHSTQGSHGVNYHHPEQGDTGYQFFMPSCA